MRMLRNMLHLFVLSVMLASISADEARSRMVVVDRASRTAFRVDVGLNISNINVTQYSVPQLRTFTDVAYDYLEDRLIILQSYYTFVSVFVNGTDSRTIARNGSVHSLTVDPHERRIFFSVYNRGIYSMNMGGSDGRLVASRTMYANEMAADYNRQMLYWSEHGTPCSCLLRIAYNGENMSSFDTIYMRPGPNAVDFENEALYGHGSAGLYKLSLRTGEQWTYRARINHWATRTVFDPKTNRLFITNTELLDSVKVYTTDGEYIGNLEGVTLTEEGDKIVLINPL